MTNPVLPSYRPPTMVPGRRGVNNGPNSSTSNCFLGLQYEYSYQVLVLLNTCSAKEVPDLMQTPSTEYKVKHDRGTAFGVRLFACPVLPNKIRSTSVCFEQQYEYKYQVVPGTEVTIHR
jgi:hypothetical protein